MKIVYNCAIQMRSCYKPLYCSIKRSFTNWPCSLKGKAVVKLA